MRIAWAEILVTPMHLYMTSHRNEQNAPHLLQPPMQFAQAGTVGVFLRPPIQTVFQPIALRTGRDDRGAETHNASLLPKVTAAGD